MTKFRSAPVNERESSIFKSCDTSQIVLQCQENRLNFPDRLSACGQGGLGTRLK